MRGLKLLGVFFKLGLMGEAEYRINFLVHLLEAAMSLATGLSVLWVVFNRTHAVGGWRWDELLVVFGLWFLTSGIVNMVVAPSIRQFMHDIWLGNLDFILIKPQNHQFLASARKFMVFQIVDVLIGAVVLTTALLRLSGSIGWEHALMFGVSIACGACILYGFWIILGTLALWTVKLENMMLVFFSMFEAGRWPAGLYPYWLRYSLTFLVPVVFAITIPAEAVIGRMSWSQVMPGVAWALVMLFVSRRFFVYGVRHKYMGASA